MKDAKGVALILGRLSKDKKDEGDEGEEEADEYSAAADEVMTALQEKDSKALGMALKSFVQMCQTEE